MKIGKIELKTNTFLKKGLKTENEFFQNVLICGYMGSGKTYYAVFYTIELLKKHKFNSIKTNIHSLKIKGQLIEYFDTIDEIYNDFEDNCLYIIDELGKRYTRESKQDNQFYGWLQQSRKCHRYCILIHQSFKRIPIWLREPVSYVFVTHKIPFTKYFKTDIINAQEMELDDNKEWTGPIAKIVVYKRIKDIADCYDTYERVKVL